MSFLNRTLDLRALALFRVLLGAYLTADVLVRVLPGFATYFSPETGILGNCFAEGVVKDYGYAHSVFGITTDAGMLAFLVLRAVFLALFTLGVATRFMAVVSLVLLWSFHLRFSTFYLGWNMYESVLLLWAAVLPVGERLALLSTGGPVGNDHRWRSPLAGVFLIQLGIIYTYNALSKNGPLWMSGMAIDSFLLEFDKHRPLAPMLLGREWITVPLSCLVLVWEWAVLPLLLLPDRSVKWRNLAALSIPLFHWGLSLFMDVGEFQMVATAGAVAVIVWPKGAFPGVFKRVEGKFDFGGLKHSVVESGLAIGLLVCMVCSNLYNHATTRTNDRVSPVLEKLGVRQALSFWSVMPGYSFFQQYWHLYSPDPPIEKGYVRMEAITLQGDTVDVFNGAILAGRGQYIDRQQKFIFLFVAIRKLRNKREMRMAECMTVREIKAWNRHRERPRLRTMQLVIYSARPKEQDFAAFRARPQYAREVLYEAAINYRN